MSLRELRVLVTHLPPESATVRAMRGHNWDDIHYMLAEILDVVKFHRVEWAMSKGAKPARPKPTTRPKTPDRSGHENPTVVDSGTGTPRRALSDRDLARAAHLHVLDQLGLGSDTIGRDPGEEV